MSRPILAIVFSLVALLNSSTALSEPALIRRASHDDIASALELDWRVSVEFFKPLFMHAYQTTLGKDPDYYIELDMVNDKKVFTGCVNGEGKHHLYVACDEENMHVVGLILFHAHDETTFEIDLLLVDNAYRRLGLGKRLINAALEQFPSAETCIVYVFSHNEPALRFYESIGFVNLGPGPADRNTIYGLTYEQVYVYCKAACKKLAQFTSVAKL